MVLAQNNVGQIDTYSQCANDDGDGYASGDTGCRWINGNLVLSNSTYYEGDATVQRLAIMDLPLGEHTVTIQYSTTKGGKHSYDFLTSDKFSENWITNADFCEGLRNFADCQNAATALSGQIPTDPNAAGRDSAFSDRYFTIRNGTWVGSGIVSGPTVVSGSYSGDSDTAIQLKFYVDPATCLNKYQVNGVDVCEVLITWGAHVSHSQSWAPELTVIDIQGSPYHVKVVELDGTSVGQRDNQMQSYQDQLITASPTPTPTPSATSIPTASPLATSTPEPIAWCNAVKLYTVNGDPNNAANWQLADLNNLIPGETIYVAVLGNVENGAQVTAARIRVTEGSSQLVAFTQLNQAVNIKPNSNPQEYYITYTFPTQNLPVPPTFVFEAEVYSPQFDNDQDLWNSGFGWR